MHNLPKKKARDPDGIAAELLQEGGEITKAMTVKLVQHIWQSQEIPSELSQALIVLIPKDYERQHDPACYRPISLMNTWLKVIDKIISNRLHNHLENNKLLSDEQAGFR